MDFNAVAHDLRAPLNVMLGHMQLLAVEHLSDTVRQRLGVLEAQVLRMMRLLDSCAGQPARMPSFAPVDIAGLIRHVLSELDALLARRAIEIDANIAEVLPPILGDRDLLHRVLMNLLINAVDSLPGSGHIDIRGFLEPPATAQLAVVTLTLPTTVLASRPNSSHAFLTLGSPPNYRGTGADTACLSVARSSRCTVAIFTSRVSQDVEHEYVCLSRSDPDLTHGVEAFCVDVAQWQMRRRIATVSARDLPRECGLRREFRIPGIGTPPAHAFHVDRVQLRS